MLACRVMEHVAQTLDLDPISVRERNFLRSMPANKVRRLPMRRCSSDVAHRQLAAALKCSGLSLARRTSGCSLH